MLLKRLFLYMPFCFLSFIFLFSCLVYVFPGVFFQGRFGFSKILFFISLPFYVICLVVLTSGYTYSNFIKNFKKGVLSDFKLLSVFLFSQFGLLSIIFTPWLDDELNIEIVNIFSSSLLIIYVFYFLPTYMYLSLVAGLQSKENRGEVI